MTVSSKLADFAPWYSQNQQFSSSCCSTRVISGPCFWELKQWQLLRSALQRAVGAGLDRWSTGWCLVWHSTWTTLHATARGSEFCQHAQSVVTVPFARSASVVLHVQFVSSLSSFTNSHFHQNSFVRLYHLIYIQEMIHYHHRIPMLFSCSVTSKFRFRGFKIQSVRPSVQVFCPRRQKMAFNKVRTQVKELIGQKTQLECSPGGLGLSNPYPKSMHIPCETPNKLLISDTWRKKLRLKKSIIQRTEQIPAPATAQFSSNFKSAWKSSQIWVLFYSCQRWSVSPEGQGESAAPAASGFSVQLDRSNRPLSSLLEAKEVKAGKDAEDGLNKALFLPSLKRKPRWLFFFFLQKKDHCCDERFRIWSVCGAKQ